MNPLISATGEIGSLILTRIIANNCILISKYTAMVVMNNPSSRWDGRVGGSGGKIGIALGIFGL